MRRQRRGMTSVNNEYTLQDRDITDEVLNCLISNGYKEDEEIVLEVSGTAIPYTAGTLEDPPEGGGIEDLQIILLTKDKSKLKVIKKLEETISNLKKQNPNFTTFLNEDKVITQTINSIDSSITELKYVDLPLSQKTIDRIEEILWDNGDCDE